MRAKVSVAMYFMITLTGLLLSLGVVAKKTDEVGPHSSLVLVAGQTMRHFDIDKDGVLNRYENSLYNSHKIFGYPLITKPSEALYDINHNLMLEPFEQQTYLKDKKSGTSSRTNNKH